MAVKGVVMAVNGAPWMHSAGCDDGELLQRYAEGWARDRAEK
jgi:hypothetical protein